jgi:hypothetical protein
MKKVFNMSARFQIIVFSTILFLAACSNDDENTSTADVQKITGDYSVEDTNEYDETETYSISIAKSGKDGNLEITNFGDIMYVPVKANVKGNVLTIPSQTFKGKTMTIVISGQGSINGDQLSFDYVIETDDDYFLEHSCIATKSPN